LFRFHEISGQLEKANDVIFQMRMEKEICDRELCESRGLGSTLMDEKRTILIDSKSKETVLLTEAENLKGRIRQLVAEISHKV